MRSSSRRVGQPVQTSFLVKRQMCDISAESNSTCVPIQASPFLDYCFFLLENNSLFVAVLGSLLLRRLSL